MAKLGDRDFDDAYPDGIERHYWNVARNAVVFQALGRLGPDDVVMDVGCGRGIFVDYLLERNVDAWGTDESAPRPLNTRVAPRLRLGRRLDAIEPELARRVTRLLLLDVLEHVDEPTQLLASVIERFPRARHLVITLPARQELWSNYDSDFGHRLRYDLDGARALLREVRADVVDARYFFHSLYPAILATARLGGRRTRVAAPAGRLSRAAHRALAACLRLDAAVLPRWLPGTSLIATARLPQSEEAPR